MTLLVHLLQYHSNSNCQTDYHCFTIMTVLGYEELSCHCGGEVMLPPIPCGGVPPTCSRPCARPHSCNHPSQRLSHDMYMI